MVDFRWNFVLFFGWKYNIKIPIFAYIQVWISKMNILAASNQRKPQIFENSSEISFDKIRPKIEYKNFQWKTPNSYDEEFPEMKLKNSFAFHCFDLKKLAVKRSIIVKLKSLSCLSQSDSLNPSSQILKSLKSFGAA